MLASNYSTLFLMIIKDTRMNRNINQRILASSANRSPSNWNKIENGQLSLNLDTIFQVCYAMNIRTSYVVQIMEMLLFELQTKNVFFYGGELDSSDDIILREMNRFYSSSGYENLVLRNNFNSIEDFYNNPRQLLSMYPDVLRYILEEKFYHWISDGAYGNKPLLSNYNGFY